MLFWIWLQESLGYGNRKIKEIFKMYKDLEKFYSTNENDWRLCGIFSNAEIKKLKSTSLKNAEIILKSCYENKIDIITYENTKYPHRLKNIPDPPAVLYTKGTMPNFDENITVSIVGTRKATAYGIQMANDISFELATSGAIIVSGGAIGIDTAVHKGTLKSGGTTAAILGCGINYPYLHQNVPLRKVISEKGVLISEYPPNYPLKKYHFRQRNRIISGLSIGTIVIEAGAKSGSLITANLANDQNRDVFVVPVNKNSPVSQGSYALIEDGAKIISCSQDILDEYKNFDSIYKIKKISNNNKEKNNCKRKIDKEKKRTSYSLSNVSEGAKKVYSILNQRKMDLDTIKETTRFEIRHVLSYITELELKGLIRSNFGKNYEICK